MTNGSSKEEEMKKLLLKIALKEKKNLFISFLLALATVGLELLSPLIIANLLDSQLLEGQGARDPRFFVLLLIVYLTSVLLGASLSFLSNYGFQRCANAIASNLQREMFHRVQALPTSYFDSHPTGHLVSRLVNDANDVRILFQTVLSQMLLALLYLVGIYTILFIRGRSLGLIALIPLPLMIGLIYFYSSRAQTYNTRYRKELSAVNAHVNESIQGMELMQSMGKENLLLSEYEGISEKLYDTGIKMTKLEALASWNAVGFLGAFTRAIILLVFGLSHYKGQGLSLGNMYLLIDFTMKIFNQLQNIMQRVGQLESAKGAYNHLGQLLDVKPDEKKDKTIEFMGELEFRNVSFNYVEDQPVLKNISFLLPQGKTLAIVGATGSGKSTIMNLVFGFYPYTEGSILVDGTELSSLDIKDFRHQCAMVLQDPYLMKASLYANLAFSRKDVTKQEALEALKALGADQLLEKFDQGLDGMIEEGGANLSSGEKQLINFARAQAHNPKLLLLDEATASIDSETEALIQESIKRLSRDRTTIIIAHRLSTIREADQILVLDKGQVIERGNHEELVNKKGAYFRLLEEEKREA